MSRLDNYTVGLAVMGGNCDVLGMFDLGVVKRNLNELRPVTVEVARILVRSGIDIIAQAIQAAKQPWYKSDLPGETERKNVQSHLEWHQAKLSRIAGDVYALYDSADDLKKYVVMAYVDANAVEEGAAYLDTAWRAMWKEVQDKIAAMPRAALKAVGGAASVVLETATGVPIWAWIGGGLVLTGLVGYLGYKVATGPVGAVVARRYLP